MHRSERAEGPVEGSAAARAATTARQLGILSVGSGLGMLVAPSALARAYALPLEPRLLRALGLRDVLIGGLLLGPESARLGLGLRAAADAGDALLVARQLARQHGAPRGASLRVAGAMALVWLSSRARAALDRAPSSPPRAAALRAHPGRGARTTGA